MADFGVAENVVRAGGLFDPQRIKFGQSTHLGDGLIDFPHLVGVHHQHVFPTDLIAKQRCPTGVFFDIAANLLFEVSPAFGQCFPRQAADFLVAIAQPTR